MKRIFLFLVDQFGRIGPALVGDFRRRARIWRAGDRLAAIGPGATGVRRNAALVAVSSGLLRGMSRSQIEAVLGHEMSHVANGDMVTLALLQGVLNTFVIFLARIIGSIVDRALEALKRSLGEPMPPQMQAFGINTGSTGGFMRLFMTHPPLDERIAALQSQVLR